MSSLSPAAAQAASALSLRISNNDVDVPLLPEVARKVIMVVNDPESDALQLSKIIQSDQTMAAHILRIANSPAYAPSGSIVSLQQAISRLGMQTMAEVAIAATVNAKMFHAPGFEKRIHTLWNASLMTALWAKEIARLTRRNVEAAFLCGLLHNIGRPMLLQWLSESHDELSEEDKLAVEEALFIDANKAVMETWGLPEPVLIGVTQYIGNLTELPEAGQQVQAAKLMNKWSDAQPEATLNEMPDLRDALAVLRLYQDEIDKLIAKRDEVLSSGEAMQL